MVRVAQLFSPDTTYVSEVRSQDKVFEEVSADLLARGLVTNEFLENLRAREKGYPTGLDMSPLDARFPNIALPHTEGVYAKVTRIVPVKLRHPIEWYSMTDPTATLDVSYLFMILNGGDGKQVELLSSIMDFVNGLGVKGFLTFAALDDPQQIFAYLDGSFPTHEG